MSQRVTVWVFADEVHLGFYQHGESIELTFSIHMAEEVGTQLIAAAEKLAKTTKTRKS